MKPDSLLGLTIAVMCAGCQRNRFAAEDIVDDSLTIVIESARIAPTDPVGQPWCARTPLEVRVAATLDGVRSETPVATGLEPRWHVAVLDAPAGEIATGLTLEVIGRCDATPFRIGALTIRPTPADIRAGETIIVSVGGGTLVRIHLEASSAGVGYGGGEAPGGSVGSDPGWDDEDPGAPCGPSDCVWIDPGGTDGSGGSAADDGSGDDRSSDDGSSDGWSDDGSSDDSSSDDSSSDDGSSFWGWGDDGSSDDGSSDDGSSDDGSSDDGSSDDGSSDDSE